MTMTRLFSRQPIIYLLTCLFSGLSSAFMGPLMSLYLIDGLQVSPINMGFLISMMILSGVVVSQYFAKKSDAGTSRKAIILMGQFGFLCSTIILALTRNYYISLATVIFFMSFSACSLPQIFTMGRNYADKYLAQKATLFITMMRASISVAWVVGPPIAFLVNDQFGFTQTFLIAACCSLSVFIIVLTGLPNLHIEVEHEVEKQVNWKKIPGVLLFLMCIFFAFSANNMYITSISLYLTQELEFPSRWAGYLMGVAAFIEIPIMLGAGYLSSKLGTHRLIFIACVSGLIFHVGILVATQPWQLLLLQVFNAVFIGVTACLGMVVAQDLMKKQMGLASTLFNSSQMLSMLLSSLMLGLIAQYFSFYAVFIVSTLFCGCAVICLYLSEQQIKLSSNQVKRAFV